MKKGIRLLAINIIYRINHEKSGYFNIDLGIKAHTQPLKKKIGRYQMKKMKSHSSVSFVATISNDQSSPNAVIIFAKIVPFQIIKNQNAVLHVGNKRMVFSIWQRILWQN